MRRYSSTYRALLQGREFVVTSVFVTMARNTAGRGRGQRPGSACVMHVADLLPSLTLNPATVRSRRVHRPL